jgi:hypothetical protein
MTNSTRFFSSLLSCGYARLARLDQLLRASPLLDKRARRRQ